MKYVLIAAFALVFLSPSPPQAETPAGKKIFLDKKCNVCHTVISEGIRLQASDSNVPVLDLSKTGDTYDRMWLAKYLVHQEQKDGRPHPTKFAGERQQLAKVAEWLAGLKTAKN